MPGSGAVAGPTLMTLDVEVKRMQRHIMYVETMVRWLVENTKGGKNFLEAIETTRNSSSTRGRVGSGSLSLGGGGGAGGSSAASSTGGSEQLQQPKIKKNVKFADASTEEEESAGQDAVTASSVAPTFFPTQSSSPPSSSPPQPQAPVSSAAVSPYPSSLSDIDAIIAQLQMDRSGPNSGGGGLESDNAGSMGSNTPTTATVTPTALASASTTVTSIGNIGGDASSEGPLSSTHDPRERIKDLRLAKECKKLLVELRERRAGLEAEFLKEKAIEEEKHAKFSADTELTQAEIERDLKEIRAKRGDDDTVVGEGGVGVVDSGSGNNSSSIPPSIGSGNNSGGGSSSSSSSNEPSFSLSRFDKAQEDFIFRRLELLHSRKRDECEAFQCVMAKLSETLELGLKRCTQREKEVLEKLQAGLTFSPIIQTSIGDQSSPIVS